MPARFLKLSRSHACHHHAVWFGVPFKQVPGVCPSTGANAKLTPALCPTGVIPAQFKDQLAAQRLAMCNDIGEAAYTDSLIAAALYEHLARLPKVCVLQAGPHDHLMSG